MILLPIQPSATPNPCPQQYPVLPIAYPSMHLRPHYHLENINKLQQNIQQLYNTAASMIVAFNTCTQSTPLMTTQQSPKLILAHNQHSFPNSPMPLQFHMSHLPHPIIVGQLLPTPAMCPLQTKHQAAPSRFIHHDLP